MRALRYYGLGDIRLEDIAEPVCKPGHIKIKPRYVGICGSDISLYFNEQRARKPGVVNSVTGEQLPVVFGHEFSGLVIEVGADVDSTTITVGDLVVVRPSIYDGTCGPCTRGSDNLCHGGGFLGIDGGGGLAETTVFPRKLVFRVSHRGTSIPADVAALVEPLAVGWHATRQVDGERLGAGSTALVLGAGPIGCAVYLALAAQGVTDIVVSEPSAARRALVRRLGARHVYSPAETEVVGKVRALSSSSSSSYSLGGVDDGHGDGAHAAFDCAGLPVTLRTALAGVRPKGTVVNVALRGTESMDLAEWMVKEVVLKHSHSYTDEDFADVIAALENGLMRPEAMITSKIAMADLVEKGIKTLARPETEDCKILVDMQAR